jgi:hypothetical protein
MAPPAAADQRLDVVERTPTLHAPGVANLSIAPASLATTGR